MNKSIAFLSAAFLALSFNGTSRAATVLEQLEAYAPGTEAAVPPVSRGGLIGGGSSHYYRPGSYVKAAGSAYRGNTNYITLYNIRSPHAMDWSDIASLSVSAARNSMLVKLAGQTHSIGHVAFEIGCTLPGGSRNLVVTGQTNSDGMGGFADQVRAGAGYSAFFGYVPGRMQTREELEKEEDTLSNQQDEVNFLTLKVSQASCLEAQRYIKAYEDEKVSSRYGLGVRPLYHEGGGCANVGVSVIEVAGPADFAGLTAPWSRTFYIPEELLGSDANHVGVMDLAGYLKYDWSKKTDKPHKVLFFYDPDLMYDWVKARFPGAAPQDKYMINSSVGLTLDYTGSSSPTGWWKTGAN